MFFAVDQAYRSGSNDNEIAAPTPEFRKTNVVQEYLFRKSLSETKDRQVRDKLRFYRRATIHKKTAVIIDEAYERYDSVNYWKSTINEPCSEHASQIPNELPSFILVRPSFCVKAKRKI